MNRCNSGCLTRHTVARRDIEEIHEQFAGAGETGWEGFTAIFTVPEEIDVPGMPVKPRRFTAKLNYRGKPFASVPIEVSTVEAGGRLPGCPQYGGGGQFPPSALRAKAAAAGLTMSRRARATG